MNENNNFREQLFAQFARIGKAISSPARVELIFLLNQGEKSVEKLARTAKLSVANTSQHLQHLKSARMVTSRKQGQMVQYRLASYAVEELWQSVQAFGEGRLLEVKELVQTYLHHGKDRDKMTREELRKKMEGNSMVLIDVRPKDEYLFGHLPKARSIPLEDLQGKLGELPRDKEIVAYCRGPYSDLSFQAVSQLQSAGLRAKRLEDGYPEWKAQSLPIEEDHS